MKKKSSPAPTRTSSPELSAAGATELLRQGRFKEAVEQFKQLVRQEPRPEWKRSLAEAYVGRARVLAGKGMVKEAVIVLENTIGADGVAYDPWLYLGCLLRQGHHGKALAYCLKHRGQAGPDSVKLADLIAALRLAGPGPVAAAGDGGEAEASVRSADRALAAWTGGGPDVEVDQALQGVSLRSAFKPLRLILKSLITVDGNPESARKLLGMVPSDSAFAGWRQAVEVATLTEPDGLLAAWEPLSPTQRTFVAEARGLSGESLRGLDDLEQAERTGPAALFALLARRPGRFPEPAARAACLELLPTLPDRLPQFEARFGTLAPFDRHRVLALTAEARGDWVQAERQWLDTIGTLSQETVPEAALTRAVIYRHLVRLAQKHEEILNGDVCDDPVATYLEGSLTADPDDLEGTLELIGHYHQSGQTREWSQWVDQAVQRFPQDSTVLMAAVEAAAGRNAYKKAAMFAKRLLEIDPINQQARHRMIELRLAHGRKQMRSSRADLASKELAEAAEWERPDAPSGPLRIAQGLVSQRLNPGPDSDRRLREGIRLAGDGVVGRLRAALEARWMGWPDKGLAPLVKDLKAALKGEPDKDQVLAVIGVLGQREVRGTKGTATQVLAWIGDWLAKGAACPWSLAEFQSIAETLDGLKAFGILTTFARHARHRDVEEPVYRFYRIAARTEGEADRLDDAESEELADIMDMMEARQEFQFINRINRYLDGEDGGSGGRRGPSRFPVGDEDFDFEPPFEMIQELAEGLEGLPEMVKELGFEGTVELMMKRLGDSPLSMIPEAFRRQLCESVVTAAMNQEAKSGGRRRRRRKPVNRELDFDE
jgi:tetratricopeptide (TPR) repeat protein